MILSSENELKKFCKEQREQWLTLAWTNGCFDILHVWHIKTFSFARSKADTVIVWLNGDASPYFTSKPGRPIHNETFRSQMLEALRDVDVVYIFQDETPIRAIECVLPDFLIKWGDYSTDSIVWADVVRNNWGVVQTVPLIEGYSTTAIIQKIRG